MSIEPTTTDQSENLQSSLTEEAPLSKEPISEDAAPDMTGAGELSQMSLEQSNPDSVSEERSTIGNEGRDVDQSQSMQDMIPSVESASSTGDTQQPSTESTAEPTADTPSTELVSETVNETTDTSALEAHAESGKKKETAPRLPDEVVQPIWDELKNSLTDSELLQVTCVRTTQGGMVVSYKDLEGFIPRGQFALEGRPEMSEIEPYVGQQVPVCVIEISDISKRKYVVSRKKGLRIEKYMALKKGDVFEGVVTSIVSYGAFVDIGGLDGLVHISRMSKIRINSPSDVVKVNDTVKVKVVDIDAKKNRISLSMKEFSASPWIGVNERFPIGTIHKGKVRNLTDYAAYVQLEPGVVGMVHVSDLSWTQRLDNPSEVVKVGQEIEVKVMDIKLDSHRMTLSLKEAQQDPWPRLANIFPVNTEVVGRIKSLLDAGIIVTLENDLDAFVPRGRMGGRKKGGKAPDLQIGEEIRLKVLEMNPEKHSIICAPPREEVKHTSPREREQTPVQFTTASSTGFTLGELTSLKNLFPQEAVAEPQVESQPVTPPQNEADVAGEIVSSEIQAEAAPESSNNVDAVIAVNPTQDEAVAEATVTSQVESAPSESIDSFVVSEEAVTSAAANLTEASGTSEASLTPEDATHDDASSLGEVITPEASEPEISGTTEDESPLQSAPVENVEQPMEIEAAESNVEPEAQSDEMKSEAEQPSEPPEDAQEEKS